MTNYQVEARTVVQALNPEALPLNGLKGRNKADNSLPIVYENPFLNLMLLVANFANRK